MTPSATARPDPDPAANDGAAPGAIPTDALARLRAESPLVHNITNHVVMEPTANALLAIGAAPAMLHSVDEVEAFTPLAGALVVNIGTFESAWLAGMKLAIAAARSHGIPWALDPVALFASPYRTAAAADLARRGPAVIRANASEVLALAGAAGAGGRGPDSTHDAEAALDAGRDLARETGAVVAITGATDYVLDAERLVAIEGGDALMARVTGTGCTATALVGAFLGAGLAPFEAACSGLASLAAAGEQAAAVAAGPGSLPVALLDHLYHLDQAAIDGRARAA
ncbi:MAG: hydroxyethylthiazole kinase [Azospirillaceae bacterium]